MRHTGYNEFSQSIRLSVWAISLLLAQLQNVCSSHYRQTYLCIYCTACPLLVLPCSLQRFLQKCRKTTRDANLLFIKHQSGRCYLTNFWWEQRENKSLIWKINYTKGQAGQKTAKWMSAFTRDGWLSGLGIRSNLYYVKIQKCIFVSLEVSSRLCICPLSVTELTCWQCSLTCCTEWENGECEVWGGLIRKQLVRC